MKNSLLILLICFATASQAQNVGIGTNTPDASAILELQDTAKGFLPPRVTYPVRKLMTNVPIGLVIWCSNCGVNGEMEVYTRQGWTTVTGGTTAAFVPDSLFVGEEYDGGIIAYMLQSGDPGYSATTKHGLIAAFSDETIAQGGAWYYVTVSNTIALGIAIGTGNANTNAIVAAQPSPPIQHLHSYVIITLRRGIAIGTCRVRMN